MPDILNTCFIYFIIVLLLLTVSYFSGQAICKILKLTLLNGLYLNLFIKTLIGSCFIIIVISLIYSGGRSINLAFVLLGIFLMIESRFEKKIMTNNLCTKQEKLFTNKNILAVVLLIAVTFLWQARILIKINSEFITGIEPDNYYYAEISKCLISTGQENTFTTSNLVNPQYHFPTPYHYYDLWLNGFISKIFHLNYALSLYLITYTFFTCVFLFGLLACFEKFGSVDYKNKIISFLLLFTGGLYISEKTLHLSDCAQMEGLAQHYGEKLAPVYCFTLLILVLTFLLNKPKLALILALCLPIISISLAPSVFGGICIYSLIKLISKEKEKSFYVRLLIYLLFTSFIFFIFYFLFKNNGLNFRFEKSLMSYSDLKNFTLFDIKFYLVELLLKCYYQPYLFILNYLPFLALISYAQFKKYFESQIKTIIFLFILFLFCGLLAYSTFYLLDDAYQLYIHAITLWHVLFAFLFILVLTNPLHATEKMKKALVILFIISLAFRMCVTFFSEQKSGYKTLNFSEKYLNEVNFLCNNLEPDTKGAIIYGPEFYNNNISTLPLEYYYFPFVFSKNIYVPFNLSAIQSVSGSNIYQTEKLLSKSPFNQFMRDFKKLNDSSALLSLQFEFIKINNIKYIITSGNQNINFEKQFVIKSRSKDPLSGQEFIILK